MRPAPPHYPPDQNRKLDLLGCHICRTGPRYGYGEHVWRHPTATYYSEHQAHTMSLECTCCCLPFRSSFFTAPCGHALHPECVESLMAGERQLRCPECDAACCRQDLWQTFYSAGEEEGAASDGVDMRTRRVLRLRQRLLLLLR